MAKTVRLLLARKRQRTMQLQVELAELERASLAEAGAAEAAAAGKVEGEDKQPDAEDMAEAIDESGDGNGTTTVAAAAAAAAEPGERAELQQDPHRGERVFLELQLRLLLEQEAAFKGALEGLATAVNQGNRTIGDVLEIFQRRARESHRAALQADLLYLESLDRGADTGNSTAQDAAAARQRRGGDLLKSVGKAADELEQGLEEHSTFVALELGAPLARLHSHSHPALALAAARARSHRSRAYTARAHV